MSSNLTAGINKLLVESCVSLVNSGVTRRNNRTGSDILELRNYVQVGNPAYRFITIPERKNNLCAQVVEMMMVLSGNPDLKYLSLFLPRAVDYSDDGGLTWRANYGIRLRGRDVFKGEHNGLLHFVRFKQDNLARVIEELKVDPSSRQCFVTIGDSNLDRFIGGTKDTPCTMTLVFGTDGDGLLELTTFMRSNDVIFGFSGVNYFIFTSLLELVSEIVGINMGNYIHHAVSYHAYGNKIKNVEEIAKSSDPKEFSLNGGMFRGFSSLEEFDALAEVYFRCLIDEECTLDSFYQEVNKVSKNRNLTSLLCATKAYLTRDSLDTLLGNCLDNTGLENLFRRDSFLMSKLSV